MYIIYFRKGKWAVAWRYSSGEKHFIAFYLNLDAAKAAAERLNDSYGQSPQGAPSGHEQQPEQRHEE